MLCFDKLIETNSALYELLLSNEKPSVYDYTLPDEIPIILVSGDCDWTTPYCMALGYFNKISSPCKEFLTIQNAGHTPFIDKPEEFSQALVQAPVSYTHLALLIFSETEYSGHLMIPADSSVQIVAHRAGAGFAPENTAAALEESIRDGTDWAEIDVQQTKDGTLIIMHDSNFKRTAGLDQNVWDTDYETVQSLDAGSSFSPQFSGEPIPTLEDMLSRAQNRINLMIELKYTGHEDKLVEKTVSLIEKYHMEKQCMIVSMNLSLLKEVKQHTRRVKTGYVSALLVTDSYDLEYIDAYSVETTSLTFQMAADAHYQRKLIYAWTANSPKTMKKILSLQADGLITDNPLLARYYLEDSGENSLLDLLKEIFFPNAA